MFGWFEKKFEDPGIEDRRRLSREVLAAAHMTAEERQYLSFRCQDCREVMDMINYTTTIVSFAGERIEKTFKFGHVCLRCQCVVDYGGNDQRNLFVEIGKLDRLPQKALKAALDQLDATREELAALLIRNDPYRS